MGMISLGLGTKITLPRYIPSKVGCKLSNLATWREWRDLRAGEEGFEKESRRAGTVASFEDPLLLTMG